MHAVDQETIDPRFDAHYDQCIRSHVEEFEAKRLVALNAFNMRMKIVVPLGLCAALVLIVLFWRHPLDVIYIIGGLGTLAICWAATAAFKFEEEVKETILPLVFNFFGPKWHYNASGVGTDLNIACISGNNGRSQSTTYMSFAILPKYEKAHTEDFLSGTYKEVILSLFECLLTVTRNFDGKKYTEDVFRGLVVTIDVFKRFDGHTVVRRDSGKIGNWFGKQFTSTLKPVALEDPRFEQRYEVYGTDQIEARYLLTNTFMERLMELEDLFTVADDKPCDIQCSFKEGKLLIMLPTSKEWFATGSIFEPATFIGDINLILKQMDQLFAIIDVLQLDDRTGL